MQAVFTKLRKQEDLERTACIFQVEEYVPNVLLHNGDIDAFEKKAMENYISLNMLTENINVKAIDEIGDYIIENNNGALSLIKEYNDICEKWVNKDE